MNLIRVSEGSTKMVRPIIGAIAYPSFLFMMSVLIIYAIGAFMVPPMLEAAPNTRWRGMAADLVDLSEWIRVNWIFAFSVSGPAEPEHFLTIYRLGRCIKSFPVSAGCWLCQLWSRAVRRFQRRYAL